MFDFTPICVLALAAQVAAFPTLDHMKQIVGGEVDANTLAAIAEIQARSEASGVTGGAAFEAPIDGMIKDSTINAIADENSFW
jgi:hypothetical protein